MSDGADIRLQVGCAGMFFYSRWTPHLDWQDIESAQQSPWVMDGKHRGDLPAMLLVFLDGSLALLGWVCVSLQKFLPVVRISA